MFIVAKKQKSKSTSVEHTNRELDEQSHENAKTFSGCRKSKIFVHEETHIASQASVTSCSTSVEHTRNSTKKKIKKSDDIIVVAKQPIEEIIRQTSGAKEVRKAIKRLRRKEDITIEKKVKDAKKEKINEEKAHDLYTQSRRLISNAYSPQTYSSKSRKIDYNALFSYLSKKGKNIEEAFSEYEKAVAKSQEFKKDELGEKKVVQEHELMSYLSRFMLNSFTGQDMNDISVDEKEKMKYYAMFNKVWIMMKISLLGFGEKTMHAYHVLDYLSKK